MAPAFITAQPLLRRSCAAGEEVIVVGGGNSAGQAAVFLAQSTKHVYILVRGSGLADTMSKYLIRRIEETPNITVLPHTEVADLNGSDRLRTSDVARIIGRVKPRTRALRMYS